MELNGDILIDALPEQVWLALNDPKVLLHSIPGCEETAADLTHRNPCARANQDGPRARPLRR